MMRIGVGVVVACSLGCLLAGPARAEYWSCGSRVVVCCYPVTAPAVQVIGVPSFGPTYSLGVPCAPTTAWTPQPQGYAVPKAAPAPSPAPKTTEPPLERKQLKVPQVMESRSFSLTGEKPGPAGAIDKCRVGFWNMSGRDITLYIGQEKHVILQNRSLTLVLNRQFSWHTGNGEPKLENVQDGLEHEIVLR
jgi:hypothetical protein